MQAVLADTHGMAPRRAFAAALALGLGGLVVGGALPAWLDGFLAMAAWLLGVWFLISIAAAVIAVRWFRARARANELMAPEGGEAEAPGEPTTR
jgi:hypothetical protein